jgi:4-hydroxybenzoate polyprenyltransferase/phosphoserine phosphatase
VPAGVPGVGIDGTGPHAAIGIQAADARPCRDEATESLPPIAVDLDGTLVRTDVLVEAAVLCLKRNPLTALEMLAWLLRGKAYLKARLAGRVTLDPQHLPYRRPVLEYLQAERAGGRRLVLVTAADEKVARQVADQLGLFDAVLASDGRVNLSGEQKRERLRAELGEKGFDYVGNSPRDLPVWASARRAVLVGGTAGLRARAARVAEVERVLDERGARPLDYLRALRLHHWLKNLLVFVPLLAAHRFTDALLAGRASLAFLAFGLCASCVYLLNDLMDLEADRHHPHKRERPLASGSVSVAVVLGLIPALLAGAVAVSLALPPAFLGLLGAYFGLNIAYSLWLKSVPVLDVLILAGFYTLRILAGSAAVGLWPSTWLLAFSMFLFLSLALVKRYAELMVMRSMDGAKAKARGYQLDDAELLASLGGGAGYLAVLVLALYIDSAASQALYSRPQLLWALCILLLYWITHLWLMAHRKRMHDDPLVFAVRNPISRTLLIVIGLVLVAAI